TLNPEKILSVVIVVSLINAKFDATEWADLLVFPAPHLSSQAREDASPPLELWRALLQKRLRAFLLVFRSGTESEERGFQRQAFSQASLHPSVHRIERVLHRDRGVRKDLLEDRFGARDQIGSRNDFVDESDAIGLLRADDLSGKDDLQGVALPDQPGHALRSTATRNESQFHFRLAELRVLCGHPDGASH